MNTEPPTKDSPSEKPLQSDIEVLGFKMTDLEQQARTLIREQPVVAVMAAAGFGYLLARIASRGKG